MKVANKTTCALRSRDAKVMKSMLSCREFICAVIKKLLSHLFRQKCYTVWSALRGISPHLQQKG